jgi:hypothetical protein
MGWLYWKRKLQGKKSIETQKDLVELILLRQLHQYQYLTL